MAKTGVETDVSQHFRTGKFERFMLSDVIFKGKSSGQRCGHPRSEPSCLEIIPNPLSTEIRLTSM